MRAINLANLSLNQVLFNTMHFLLISIITVFCIYSLILKPWGQDGFTEMEVLASLVIYPAIIFFGAVITIGFGEAMVGNEDWLLKYKKWNNVLIFSGCFIAFCFLADWIFGLIYDGIRIDYAKSVYLAIGERLSNSELQGVSVYSLHIMFNLISTFLGALAGLYFVKLFKD